MIKSIGVTLTAILISLASPAQVMPADFSTVNYRIAGFSVPENARAASYQFQIAKGDIANEQAFRKATIIKHKTNKAKDIVELPAWGEKYTWRVLYCDNTGKEIGSSGLHHVQTGAVPYVDTSKNGMVILRKATDHHDLYILLDRTLVIYDLNGKAVWYMPDIPELKKRDINIRDFKATATGTFTFLTQEDALEVDYNGNIVWKAPNDGKVSGKSTEGYHHEFTKLSNGHYMIAGAEIVKKRIPGYLQDYFAEGDKSVSKGSDGSDYKEFTCGTLIEYDATGKVVWSWKTAEHMEDQDFFWNKERLTKPYDSNPYLNGFDFDENNKEIYISYKSINRIIKITYPGGDILKSYGDAGSIGGHSSPFYGQHSCRINKRTNELYVYNNNHSDYIPVNGSQMDADGYLTSHVVKYKQPPGKSNELIKNWDVGLRLTQDKNAQQVSIRGGSVSILDDDCVLVNAGTLNLLMIIDKQKQKVWEAVPYTTEDNRKAPLLPYRCSYMNKKDMEKFLFRKLDSLARK